MKRIVAKVIDQLKSDALKRSMLLNTFCRPVSMLISMLYTPVLLNYLGEEAYGLWSTILSIINWINYFDVGVGNGLRNMLTRDIENQKKEEANSAVSTAYVALSFIASTVFMIGTIIILCINTQEVFNTRIILKPALMVSFSFICINFILALSKVQLYATHQSEKVGYMTVLNQMMNLIGVWLLSCFSESNMLYVAIVIGLSGVIVNLFFSGKVWRKHNYLVPRFKKFDKTKLKGICNVGIKFFIIQMAALVLYSTDNMIITKMFGPSYVTPYHTVYSAFGIVNGLFVAMLSPLWAKYTVAKQHNDYLWMKKSVLNLDKFLIPIGIILMVGIVVFKPISVIWLKKELVYDTGLITCMALYYFLISWGNIYTTVMNGIGRINLQLGLAVFTAILNIPLSIFLGGYLGMHTTGVLLATVICMLITDIPVTIDVHRYLNKKINA